MDKYLEDLKALDKIYYDIKNEGYFNYHDKYRDSNEIEPKKLESYINKLQTDKHISISKTNPRIINYIASDFEGYENVKLKQKTMEDLTINNIVWNIESSKTQVSQYRLKWYDYTINVLVGLAIALGIKLLFN